MNSLKRITKLSPSIVWNTTVSRQSLNYTRCPRMLAIMSGRCLSTSVKPIYDISLLEPNDKTVMKARELLGINKIPKYILRKSSIYLYEACTDKIDIERFITTLELEDTFSTWFNITKLHVWMVSSRCMAEEGSNGEVIRNELINRMWDDCTSRVNKLGTIKSKLRNAAIKNYHHEFTATLTAMDEGLLTDDITLAGALWRTIFGMNKNPNPEHIELLVKYVRAQMDHLYSNVKSENILFFGNIRWKPFDPFIIQTEPKSK